jgi:peptide/nickel transport system permease protein
MSGYLDGRVDTIISTLTDILLAFPNLLLALAIVTVLGPGLTSVVLAVALAAAPGYVRVVRAVCRSLRRQEFVEAARAVGATERRILTAHIGPNIVSPVIVLSTLALAQTVLAAAGLSFLGVGAQPPTPELGALLADGRAYIAMAWWQTVAPAAAILCLTLGVNVFGDWLRDALDPRLRE